MPSTLKSFQKYLNEYWDLAIPDYPAQLDPKKDTGGWVTGDPPKPITNVATNAEKALRQASKKIKKERGMPAEDAP